MDTPQLLIIAILVATMALFLWGKFRHDVVALASLMACVIAGLVPADAAFAGFAHPAVITVACVLILSQGLQTTGAVDWLARTILPRAAGRTASLAALMGLGALLSGFMNNVGAMALLMPVAVQVSGRLDMTPGQVLMPLAFATILGGMTTLIGTPPNLIVSGFRAQAGLGQFAMFDFAPVGVAVALCGVIFIICDDPWRHDHADRHAAQPDRVGFPRAGGAGPVCHVRLCARGCGCRPVRCDLHHRDRLAAGATAQGGGRRRFCDRCLYDRGPRTRRQQGGRPDPARL
ncbi:hypothetical protein SKA53_13581 [Yoonia vestfoldensis SKA53]|uniref:Citrate transporter-like domain-containing protein n=1 Tax=Yoonia vestfoldensis SKA53 TaxID=314232 RepID=A3V4L4_9RHOB|nr:SLC13 family permease [Yoonia vestfoldensis]EAQ06582.1 hypothetical protein SKA53_13581 [Yoonia vestfoldensis SKA53]